MPKIFCWKADDLDTVFWLDDSLEKCSIFEKLEIFLDW